MYRKSFLKRFPKIIHPVTRECRWLKEKAEKIPMLPIYFQGIRYHLGSFKNIDAAVNAREEAENKLYADFLEWYAEEYPERWKRLKKRD